MANEEQNSDGLEFHPMDQFIVKPLFGEIGDPVHIYTVTNVTLWLAITVLAVIGLLVMTTTKRSVIPSRGQAVAEMAYGFVYKMVEDVTGKDGGQIFSIHNDAFRFLSSARIFLV